MSAAEEFATWAIVELMGHRRLAGFVSEATLGGAAMLRLDIPAAGPVAPDASPWSASQFYSGAAVYCITPTTEEIARAVAARAQPSPVARWELKRDDDAIVDADVIDEEDDDGGFFG